MNVIVWEEVEHEFCSDGKRFGRRFASKSGVVRITGKALLAVRRALRRGTLHEHDLGSFLNYFASICNNEYAHVAGSVPDAWETHRYLQRQGVFGHRPNETLANFLLSVTKKNADEWAKKLNDHFGFPNN